MEEAPQQRTADTERRVRNHVERSRRQAEVAGIGADHDHGGPEPLAESIGPLGM
jgi:hypothetical protein